MIREREFRKEKQHRGDMVKNTQRPLTHGITDK